MADVSRESTTSFAKWELFPLARGGMGTASLGCVSTDSGFERLVVIKRLNESTARDPVAQRRLIEEAELAGLVHHANVVPVQYVGQDEDGIYLVLDYIEGASLGQMLDEACPSLIDRGIVLRLFLDVLAGLDAIHHARDHLGEELNILHRDATPDNILVGLDGVARLTDFGIAKHDGSAVHTGPMTVMGKHGYMAPEYLLGECAGPAMDVYSIGVSLWICLTGRSPFHGLESAQILSKTVHEGVPDISRFVDLPVELSQVVKKACAREQAQRFQSAQEFARALEQCAHFELAPRYKVVDYVSQRFSSRAERLRGRAAEEIRSTRRISQSRLRASETTVSPLELTEPVSSEVDFGRRSLRSESESGSHPRFDAGLPTLPTRVVPSPVVRSRRPLIASLMIAAVGLGVASSWILPQTESEAPVLSLPELPPSGLSEPIVPSRREPTSEGQEGAQLIEEESKVEGQEASAQGISTPTTVPVRAAVTKRSYPSQKQSEQPVETHPRRLGGRPEPSEIVKRNPYR